MQLYWGSWVFIFVLQCFCNVIKMPKYFGLWDVVISIRKNKKWPTFLLNLIRSSSIISLYSISRICSERPNNRVLATWWSTKCLPTMYKDRILHKLNCISNYIYLIARNQPFQSISRRESWTQSFHSELVRMLASY